jgi:pyruvate/2-oxoglutarate dehydrogenase complex dihydrolipoamide acyltransferase (E2) component
MPGIAAQNAVEEARIRLGTTPMRIGEHTAYLNVHGVAGVVEWSVHDSGEDELMVRAVQALEAAEASTYGKVIFLAAPETAELQQPAALSIEIEEVEQALPVFWEREVLEKEPFPNGEDVLRSNGGQPQTEVENAMEPVGEKPSPDERQEVGPLESEPKATRAAQKLAQEYGIVLNGIRGSGKDERIVKADIEKLI